MTTEVSSRIDGIEVVPAADLIGSERRGVARYPPVPWGLIADECAFVGRYGHHHARRGDLIVAKGSLEQFRVTRLIRQGRGDVGGPLRGQCERLGRYDPQHDLI